LRAQKSVARRYAEALVNVVADEGDFQAVDEELQRFLAVLEKHPHMYAVVVDPSLSRGDKQKFIQEVAELLELGARTQGLLALLVHKERLAVLGDIAQSYRQQYKERLGLLEVEVRSVLPLSASQLERVDRLVHRLTGKKAEVRQVQDRALLGGLVVRMGNTLLDASVRNHLERIRRSLVSRPGESESEG